jgi:hypothetical protein
MLKNTMSNGLKVVVFSLVLLTGILIISSTAQIQIYGQQQQQQQPQPKLQYQKIGISKIINQIGQRVAGANPNTNSTLVEQVIVQLAEHTAQNSGIAQANNEISQIASNVDKYPNGIVSQLLSHFAQELTLQEGEAGYDDALVEEDMPSAVTILPDKEAATDDDGSGTGEE